MNLYEEEADNDSKSLTPEGSLCDKNLWGSARQLLDSDKVCDTQSKERSLGWTSVKCLDGCLCEYLTIMRT